MVTITSQPMSKGELMPISILSQKTRFIQANLSFDGIKELLEINILVNQILEFC